jgi:hypothetical protein
VTAGAAGFLTFSQQSARPERYGDPRRFDTMPSERTGPPVDDCAIRGSVRIERDSHMLAAQQRLQGALAGFDRLATQILAVEL